MDRALSFSLHALTARLDRAADRILRAEHDLSYRRFMVLFMVGELGVPTQRALAERLGVTEPSVSRMISALSGTRLLQARPDPAGGNRRLLDLTPNGRDLVQRCGELLEGRLAALVESSGVPYDVYSAYTDRLLNALEPATAGRAPRRPPAPADAAPEHGEQAATE